MFDPYHKWLGILPKDQPPNHYRLLSLEPFESDLDVIEGAADRQMFFIRQYQSGEHAALAAKLLNEIAAARLCLLKPKSKAEYDAALKRKLVLPEDTKGDGVSFSFDPELAAPLKAAKKPPAAEPTTKVPRGLLIAGGLGAVFVLLTVAIFLMQGGKPPKKTEPADQQIAESKSTSLSTVEQSKVPETAETPAVEPSPASKIVAPIKPPLVVEATGSPVDLLSLVDIARDKIVWESKKDGSSLICGPGGTLYLPSALPDDYQLEIRVKRLDGGDGLSIGFTMTGRQAFIAFDGWDATLSGLFVDGRHGNTNCTTHPGKIFRNGSLSTLVLTVRPGHVRADADNKTVIDWYGDPERMFVPEDHGVVNRECAYLAAGRSSFQFESVMMTPIKPLPDVSKPRQLDHEIELLPLIDVQRDKARGTWELTKYMLSSDGNGGIYLPTEVPEEYTVSATVEFPLQAPGDTEVSFGLVSGKSCFQVVSRSDMGGLDSIDGRRWNENETRFVGQILKPGVPARFECTVTKQGIRTEIDGKTLIDWYGDVRRLSIAGDWALSDARRLFLASNRPMKFRDIKIGPPRPAPPQQSNPQYSIGQPVDLLAVDPARDALAGTWTKEESKLRAMGDAVLSKLVIPSSVPEEYKLSIRVKREEGGRVTDNQLAVMLPIQSFMAEVILDGHSSTVSGIHLDGMEIGDPNNVSSRRLQAIPMGAAQTIDFFVRRTGVKVVRGTEVILDWVGNPARLWRHPDWATPVGQIALGTWNQRFLIEKIDIEPLEASSFPSIGEAGSDGNLLPVIDPRRDSRKGEWTMTSDGLVCPAFPAAWIQIPCSVPDRYELALTVERKSGVSEFQIGLLVGGHSCTAALDGGTSAGLMYLDNFKFFSPANPTFRKYTDALLPTGKPVKIRCFVLPDTVIVICGSREVLRWHGDSRRFTLGSAFVPPNRSSDDRHQLHLCAWQSEFLIRELTLKPLDNDETKRISDEFTGVFPVKLQADVPFATAPEHLSAGEAKPTAPTNPAKSSTSPSKPPPTANQALPKGKWIELLEFVQLPEHSQIGNWERREGSIICEPSQDARFMVPIALRGSYELKCEFTRNTGDQNVAVVFPVGLTSCSMTLSLQGGSMSGLMVIDGLGVDQLPPESSAVVRPGKLVNGKRYQLQIEVTQNGEAVTIKTSLDGKRLVGWQGNVAQLTCSAWQSLPCPQSIGVVASESETEVHKLELRMKNDAKGFVLGTDWKNPLAVVAAAPGNDIAARCVDWNGKKYFISEEAMSFPAAQTLAAQLRGRMLTISSPEEEAFLRQHASDRFLWLSAWRRQASPEWRDERNRPLKVVGPWRKGEPNSTARETVVVFHAPKLVSDRGWYDMGPWAERHACIEWGRGISG